MSPCARTCVSASRCVLLTACVQALIRGERISMFCGREGGELTERGEIERWRATKGGKLVAGNELQISHSLNQT